MRLCPYPVEAQYIGNPNAFQTKGGVSRHGNWGCRQAFEHFDQGEV